MSITDQNLSHLVAVLVRKLAEGWNQKKLCQQITPDVCQHQHRAIFAELSRWVFATEGVLSHLYQPLLAQRTMEAGHDPMQWSQDVATSEDVIQHPPISQHSILHRLPNELFDNVLEYLPRQDVNDVRLTCRQSRNKSFQFWSKHFFKTRQFMIDEYSIQTLLAISRHSELCSVLTHLIIGVDEIDTKDTLSFLEGMYATSPSRIPTVFRYWRDAAAAQQALLHTGRAVKLLSEAMSNLTNLETVTVSGSKRSRYMPCFPDMLPYPDLGLRSYGSSAYMMQRRYVKDENPSSKRFIDRVFNCVLNSLVQSSPNNLKTLRSNLDRDMMLRQLDDEAFDLSPFAPFFTDKLTVTANLTELQLDVNLASKSVRKTSRLADHRHTFDARNGSLRQLLCSCCSLERLTLNVHNCESYNNHCDFTAWLVEPANCPTDTRVYWPFLRRLALKGLYISPAKLRSILVKFDTVTFVALESITLIDCFLDQPPIPDNSSAELENHWASFFRGTSAVLSNLESLELKELAVERYRQDPNDVVTVNHDKDLANIAFVPEAPKPGSTPPSWSVTVTDFRREALETLADQTWFFEDWTREKAAADPEGPTPRIF